MRATVSAVLGRHVAPHLIPFTGPSPLLRATLELLMLICVNSTLYVLCYKLRATDWKIWGMILSTVR